MESVFYVVTLCNGDYFEFNEKEIDVLSKLIDDDVLGFTTLKDSDGDEVAIRLSSIVSIKKETFGVCEVEKTKADFYSEKQLIDFGNYLLSEQRTNSIIENVTEVPSHERLKNVTDADLQNFFNK